MMAKILVVDTNNFVEPLESGFKNIRVESSDLKELLGLLDRKGCLLVLPESVKIECERLCVEKKKELEDAFNKLKEDLSFGSKEVREKVINYISEIESEEKEKLKSNEKILSRIFAHRRTELVLLDTEIYLSSYKRLLKGGKPFNKKKHRVYENQVVHSVHPDVVLIESVKSYLTKKSITNYKLLLCTKDPDFREEEGAELDGSIRTEFVDAKLYKTLRECLRSEFSVDLPPLAEGVEVGVSEGKLASKQPPVPIQSLIDELERSGSFDTARRNMGNILNMKQYLSPAYLKRILKAMFLNPYNYTINQVLAVDVEQQFSKNLYLVFKGEVEAWRDFADDLVLFYGSRYESLKDYDWLFSRLGISYLDNEESDIPF